ncbi:ATP-binding protein [Ruegeria sp. HKCCD8929]|uniref:ATP-binding protein n=1 Tax=Ruegeria sp. HKCCD8929 TaxID=2683006 RepID=UPI0014899A96|nr:ATP-binding protein [Ruegeria sp. HKCCD8929]
MTAGMNRNADMALTLIREGLDTTLSQVNARLTALVADEALPEFDPPETSAFPVLAHVFHLSVLEQEVLALAAGHDLDDGIAAAMAQVNGNGALTPALLERLIGAAIWDILCPEAPLRRWRLIEMAEAGPVRARTLRLDERILQALLGTHYLDARLDGLVRLCPASTTPPGQEPELARAIAAIWRDPTRMPLIQLGGRTRPSRRQVVICAAQRLSVQMFRLNAADIPTDWTQRQALAVLLDRELALLGAAALIEAEPETGPAAATLADLLSGPVILSAEDPPDVDRTPRVRLELDPPEFAERQDIWRQQLGPRAEALGPALDRLAGQFALDPPAIEAAASLATEPGADLATTLWRAAREQGRRALDGLAERIESRATWDDLVLPPSQMAVLRDLAGHLRDAWRVNNQWGWAARNPRGLGAAALFAGPSGTGKTLAAEVLAGALKLDLYRIDLSQVVSKYIGETEKNLSRIFAAAEDGGAILLFDEADALFGKRSEVKDSHDRYANVEVSYLLQRMEAYRGLAVLTTNQKSALDTAFLRRLRYVVNFPFPDAAARAEIWARVFPPETPREGLDFSTLSRLGLSGGSIRSIALNASYLAASGPEPVQMHHIKRAAQREYSKLEKPFSTNEQGVFA